MKICSRCRELKHDIDFTKGQNYCRDCKAEYKRIYHEQNREYLNKRRSEWRAKDKLTVLSHYSEANPPVCIRCGFTDIRALSIDHIYGGGTAQKKDYEVGGNHFYAWLRRQGYPSSYQVLCMNCQFIKRREMKEWANV